MQVNYSYEKSTCHQVDLCITDRNMGIDQKRSQSQIAQALEVALKGTGRTQTWLAEQIGAKSQGTISKYFRYGKISAPALEKMCQVLGVRLSIEGAEDAWELRQTIARVRELHELNREALGKILFDLDAIIRALNRPLLESVSPKGKAAGEAAREGAKRRAS